MKHPYYGSLVIRWSRWGREWMVYWTDGPTIGTFATQHEAEAAYHSAYAKAWGES